MHLGTKSILIAALSTAAVLGSVTAAEAATHASQCTTDATTGSCQLTGSVSAQTSVAFSVNYTATGSNTLTYKVLSGSTVICSGATTPSAPVKTFSCTVPKGNFTLQAQNDTARADVTQLKASY